ncbi:exodeoxyribonuclease VII large subunit [Chitinibacteraceae bacterium HSL-7]
MSQVLSSVSGAPIAVSELNRTVRTLLEGTLPVLWVSGEISGFKRYPSGHCYFTLKDSTAQVRCVMFRGRAALLDFAPGEGMAVEARAVVTLYEARGDYQLTVEALRPAGLGQLHAAFEALKARLGAEGLFAADRKRALPDWPRAIGIVTSPQAAALRDMLTTLRRRMPSIPVVLYPTAVQGAAAAAEIARAIVTAGQRAEVDVLIVGRGGGSLEDLWAFNEEVVARAIAASPLPVVSAVGHETDFTIADLVADIRAATPTAAAELVTPEREEWLQRLARDRQRWQRAMARQLETRALKLDALGARLRHPGERLRQQGRSIEGLRQRLTLSTKLAMRQRTLEVAQLARTLRHQLPDTRQPHQSLQRQTQQLKHALSTQLQRQQQRLNQASALLAALNPDAVLQRGYAVIERRNGEVVQQGRALAGGDAIRLRFADTHVDATVDLPPPSQRALFDEEDA